MCLLPSLVPRRDLSLPFWRSAVLEPIPALHRLLLDLNHLRLSDVVVVTLLIHHADVGHRRRLIYHFVSKVLLTMSRVAVERARFVSESEGKNFCVVLFIRRQFLGLV